MKPRSTLFLQAVIILIAIAAIVIMIRFPLMEGRAKNLDLLKIYLDPLILYVYLSSSMFFLMLYQAFKLLGYIRQSNVFTYPAVRTLTSIKRYAVILSILIIVAGLSIAIFHNKEDDPAGFIALSTMAAFVFIVISNVALVLESIIQNGMNINTTNEKLST